MSLFKINPVVRISFSLIAILVAWLLLLELTIGIWPKQETLIKKNRESTVINLVTRTSEYLKVRDFRGIDELLNSTIKKDSDILSAAIRLKNGQFVVKTEAHEKHFNLTSQQPSTIDDIRIELNADNAPWADFEIAFKPTQSTSFFGWFKDPKVLAILGSILGAIFLFSLYLKKIFHHLDPSSVIPDRVRAAFDAFGEGVLMIDRSGYLVLMNKTVNEWLGKNNPYFGKHLTELPWLSDMRLDKSEKFPWSDAMDTQEAVQGMRLDFKDANGEQVNGVLNCTPVIDANKVTRGCLITVDNITDIEKLNSELKLTNEQLIGSRAELDKQNEELRKLATRDPLTNCLNRRSFYEFGEALFNVSQEKTLQLTCIMFDIDFFKKVNDVHGHAVGDKVIIAVAKAGFSGLRADDLLCRYGGEEFCILLPDAGMEIGMQLAERLRAEIEAKSGLNVLDGNGDIKVTSSFGVASLTSEIENLAEMIDIADQALYKAKKQGRNCVVPASAITNKKPTASKKV